MLFGSRRRFQDARHHGNESDHFLHGRHNIFRLEQARAVD